MQMLQLSCIICIWERGGGKRDTEGDGTAAVGCVLEWEGSHVGVMSRCECVPCEGDCDAHNTVEQNKKRAKHTGNFPHKSHILS